MRLPHPLPNDLAELIARRFRVIGEPMRIRLLDRLRDGEATVTELTEALGASQQNVSKHLAVLAEAGILGRRKDGNRVYYRVVDEGVFALCEARLRLPPAAARRAPRAHGRGGLVTTVAASSAPDPAAEHPEAVGPIGRLGRWTADHVRAVAIAWVVVAVGARLLRAEGRDARSRARAGRRTAPSRCRRAS